MPKKKLYILDIGSTKILGTKAKLQTIQRALVGAELVARKNALCYTHPGHNYSDPDFYVESGFLSTELKSLSDAVLTEEEFSILRRAAEQDWDEEQKKKQLALPEPRKELPAPRLELPYNS